MRSTDVDGNSDDSGFEARSEAYIANAFLLSDFADRIREDVLNVGIRCSGRVHHTSLAAGAGEDDSWIGRCHQSHS